jgi:hypothetical protein
MKLRFDANEQFQLDAIAVIADLLAGRQSGRRAESHQTRAIKT